MRFFDNSVSKQNCSCYANDLVSENVILNFVTSARRGKLKGFLSENFKFSKLSEKKLINGKWFKAVHLNWFKRKNYPANSLVTTFGSMPSNII